MSGNPLQSIIITGASSGIGSAVALNYAAPGVILGLIGRDTTRLEGVAKACRAKGADVETAQIDVRDKQAMADFLLGFDAKHPVDIILANAGVNIGTASNGALEDADKAVDLIHINICGVLNTVHPLLDKMRARRAGQIGIVSSLSAFTPLPDAPSYSASKAALLAYACALREKVRRDGVKINAICPGFIDTPLASNYIGWKPFAITAEKAAVRICDGLAVNRAVISFPMILNFVAHSLGYVPGPLFRQCLKLFRFTVTDSRVKL